MRDFDQEFCRAFPLLSYDLLGRWSGGERVRCLIIMKDPTQGWLWLDLSREPIGIWEEVTWNAAVQSARRSP